MGIGSHEELLISAQGDKEKLHMRRTTVLLLALGCSLCSASEFKPVYPAKKWATKTPAQAGLDEAKLKEIPGFARGSGCVVRHGYMIYTWGEAHRRRDVASAAKPIYSHFLLKADDTPYPILIDYTRRTNRHVYERVYPFTPAKPLTASTLPMVVTAENTAQYRWPAKPVHASRLLDDMESLSHWRQRSTFGYGAPSEIIGTMALTTERFRDGSHSIRLRSPTKLDRRGPQMGRPFGTTTAIRTFDGEDWSDYNRVSFWVYPELPGFHSISLLVQLRNEGAVRLPGPGRLGMHFLNLKNHGWNHVLWEIPDLPRDRVTGVEFQYRLQGNEPGATDTVVFDIDQLELQQVDADYFEGWAVAPGRIAYCHTGYQAHSLKRAIASGLEENAFQLIDGDCNQVALAKEVETIKTPLGEFQSLDFSEITRSGTYVLRAGKQCTKPFRIGPDIWSSTISKAINYFYCQRCGDAINGIHDVCHQDWQGVHGDKTIIINGGWHDAGDVCQGLKNSCEAVGAMLNLAEQLRFQRRHPELVKRLIDEARWGLQYVLKNNFGDGYRVAWATHDFWTNGKIGDADDVIVKARNGPRENFAAAVAEAIAYRVLREEDPDFAAVCLKAAESDWWFAAEAIKHLDGDQQPDMSGIGASSPLDLAAIGSLASIELFQATGDRTYAELAIRLARTVVACQQRTYLPGLKVLLAGFFRASPTAKEAYHAHHRGHAHTPVMALAALCRTLPDHPDWMEWYSCVAYYSEFLKTLAEFTAPYGVFPASLYRDDEHLQMPAMPPRGRFAGYAGATRESFRRQVINGVNMGGGYYLRRFPVWFMIRGHFGVLLTKTKALSCASRLRGDLEAANLAERQLQWMVGSNPFAQSTMYGEGYDYVPHYSAMSGQIVGSLPVGIETLLDHDEPYWSVHNHMNSKETWVYPVTHWLSVLSDLIGVHEVASTDDRSLTLAVTHRRDAQQVAVQVTAQGEGHHRLTVRANNIQFERTEKTVDLERGKSQRVTWQGRIESSNAPWIAVVIPDMDVTGRIELVDVGKPHVRNPQ
jgi:hypothetical protein